MRLARSSRLLIAPVLMALALSACAKRHPPPAVAAAGLDAVAYGVAPPPPVVVPAPVAFAAEPIVQYVGEGYRLDSGDRLRVVVYGQDGLTNSYAVDASGHITMPLIGAVKARGSTPAELSRAIAARLRKGFIREPFVAAEVEAYRPFFILGEVTAPGQYPFVPNMTIEAAVAIAGGFSPRAKRKTVQLTRNTVTGPVIEIVPVWTPLSPGDTVTVKERWF